MASYNQLVGGPSETQAAEQLALNNPNATYPKLVVAEQRFLPTGGRNQPWDQQMVLEALQHAYGPQRNDWSPFHTIDNRHRPRRGCVSAPMQTNMHNHMTMDYHGHS